MLSDINDAKMKPKKLPYKNVASLKRKILRGGFVASNTCIGSSLLEKPVPFLLNGFGRHPLESPEQRDVLLHCHVLPQHIVLGTHAQPKGVAEQRKSGRTEQVNAKKIRGPGVGI